MKKNILIVSLLSVLFLALMVGIIVESINLLGIINQMSNTHKILLNYPDEAFQIEIPSVIYYFFGNFLTSTVLAGFVGYLTVKKFKPLLIELKAIRKQKAEADKQNKIAALEAQLEELKKD